MCAKPTFVTECLVFLDQRKLPKMQWIQDPSRSNVDNLNNVRHEAIRYFRNKKKAYLRAKIEELETNSKINNIRNLYGGINDFKTGNQPRTIILGHFKSCANCAYVASRLIQSF